VKAAEQKAAEETAKKFAEAAAKKAAEEVAARKLAEETAKIAAEVAAKKAAEEEAARKAAEEVARKAEAVQKAAEDLSAAELAAEYVVISRDEVPPADSDAVTRSLPSVTPIQKEENMDTNQSGQEVKVNGTNGTNHTQSDNPSNGDIDSSDLLFCRKYVDNIHADKDVASKLRFSVASYNILADCHAQRTSYPWVSKEHLSMTHRADRLRKEIRYLDADVLCLQEVDPNYYADTLVPLMKAKGFAGVFKKRVDDYFNEGEATFWRLSRFTLAQHRGHALKDLACKDLSGSGLEEEKHAAVQNFLNKPSVVLLTQLKCNNTDRLVTVANIHVSFEWLQKPDLQCIEVACAVKEVVRMCDGPSNSHVIAGDFNSWAGTPTYQLAMEGYLNDASMASLQSMANVEFPNGSKASLVNLWWRGFQHTSNCMTSAYAEVMGREPVSTSYPNSGSRKAVDLIWFGGTSLSVSRVLDVPPESATTNPGLPSPVFPSDHLSIKADLYFK